MTDESSDPTRVPHPRLDMQGPRASTPAGAAAGDNLPYAGDRPAGAKPRWPLIAAGVAVAVIAVGGLGLALGGGSDGDGQAAPTTAPAASTPASTGGSTAPQRSTTTAAPKATGPKTTAPKTTTPAPTTTLVPVDQLPPHRAIYKDGKLILTGTVPSKAIGEKFRAKAAAVVGAANVVYRYQYDPRVAAPTDGRVEVAENLLFAKNSAEITPSYFPLLDLGVVALRLNPHATATIVGYTDDSGTLEVNQALSQERAQAIVDYVAAQGIDPARLQAVGRGPADPVAPNDTEENRARNRRIELELVGLLS